MEEVTQAQAQAHLESILGEEYVAKIAQRREKFKERFEGMDEDAQEAYKILYHFAERLSLQAGMSFFNIAEAANLLGEQFYGMQETRSAIDAAERVVH